METKLQRWGNSVGVRIPQPFLKKLELDGDSKVLIEEVDEGILIKKIERPFLSFAERLKEYDGPNLVKEYSWDDLGGNDKW